MPGFELIGKEEQEAVNEIFEKSGGVFFAHGFDQLRNNIFKVRELETAFSKHTNSPYCQAVTSGSAALKVALKAANIQPGDEVITQSFTFIATVEAIIECGATPIIVDINKTLNIDPSELKNAITDKTKAIIPVHMMGCAADMIAINTIAQEHNLTVIEDAAWGCGASLNGQALGTFGDFGCFSLDAGKVITCGEGGLITCKDKTNFQNARAYHDHGHEYSDTLGRAEEAALCQGFNYRMTDLQAAVALAQLNKLDYIVEQQRKNKRLLQDKLNLPFEYQHFIDEDGDNANSLIFFCESKTQAQYVVSEMQKNGLGTKNLPDAIKWHFSKYWTHLYKTHPLYKDNSNIQWKRSESILEKSIALPVNVNMTESQIDHISTHLNKIVSTVPAC